MVKKEVKYDLCASCAGKARSHKKTCIIALAIFLVFVIAIIVFIAIDSASSNKKSTSESTDDDSSGRRLF